jgi:hypothetical protein
MGLAKMAVLCSADTFVVKIATFAKPCSLCAANRDLANSNLTNKR